MLLYSNCEQDAGIKAVSKIEVDHRDQWVTGYRNGFHFY